MAIHIWWHRVWGLGGAISGVCKRDNETYWFEWNELKKVYHAYSLTEENIRELDSFRESVQAVLGNTIYHDDSFGFTVSDKEWGIIPEMPFIPTEFAFTFPRSEVVNPVPGIL